MELVIQIISEATVSQSSYRSLVLVSRTMRNIVRLEFLKTLPIVLTRENQYESFLEFVQSDPEVGSSIQCIWMIPLDYDSIGLPELILTYCPNIVSLACQPQSLLSFLSSSSDAELTSCKELTLHDCLPSSWSTRRPNFLAFCSQIERLHLIGPFIATWTIPTFPNLLAVSISHGQKPINVLRFREVFQDSTKLEKIALTTDLENMKLRVLQAEVMAWNDKESVPEITLYSLPQDWTDVAVWLEGLYDMNFLEAVHQRVVRRTSSPLQRLVVWWHNIKGKPVAS